MIEDITEQINDQLKLENYAPRTPEKQCRKRQIFLDYCPRPAGTHGRIKNLTSFIAQEN
jgi:hypothetical protein